jgi:membrane protein DedA with SNARE-associated domain
MQHFIISYGYLAVFLLMLAESACIPIPSEVTMLFAGAIAGGAVAGAQLSLVAVTAAGVLGNVVGSYLAWGVGRYGGPAAWRKWGRYVGVRDHDMEVAQRWFDRHGSAAVCYGRLLPVVRTFISLPAGFAGMRPVRFGLYTLAGCIPWTLALAWIGAAVGSNWQRIADGFHGPTLVMGAVIVAAGVIGLVVHLRRRRRRPAAARPR